MAHYHYSWLLFLQGRNDEAEKILSDLKNSKMTSWIAMGIAVICGALGKLDEAWQWIAYQPAHAWIPWIAVMPMWKPLYGDPRFLDFVERLKLPE